MASTATPQMLLGVPQPVVNQSFTVYVVVEAQADATPLATGNVTLSWGDATSTTTSALNNSVVTATHSYASTGNFTITASYAGDANYSAASTSQLAISLATAPAAVQLNTFGDSITAGVGASPKTEDWASQTATDEGWTLNNYGVSGDESLDTCEIINAAGNIPASNYNMLYDGQNDLSSILDDGAAGIAQYTSTMTSCAVWLATTAGGNRTNANSSAITRTGSWSASTLYTSVGLNSTVAASTLSGSFTGNVFYAQMDEPERSNYTVSIAIDGGAPTNYTPPQLNYVGHRITYAPYSVRIPLAGAATGVHTVTFNCVTPGTTGCYVDWFAGNSGIRANAPPYVWLLTSYQTQQTGFDQANYAALDSYQASIVSQLAADGFNVHIANVANWFNGLNDPNCMYNSIHPSNCGHTILAGTVINAMNFLLADVPSIKLSTAGLHNYGYVTDGQTVAYGVQITNATTAVVPISVQLSGAAQFTQATNCVATLAVGASCELVFYYAPSASISGLQQATWSLTGPGAGVTPQNGGTLLGQGTPTSQLTLNATAHDFGTISDGSASTMFGLIIANPSSAAFSGNISLTGATSQFQMVSNNCTLPLPAHATCVVQSTFAPTTTGWQTANLTITPTEGETITPGGSVTFLGYGAAAAAKPTHKP